jgi:beta-N-acetylhexosaminidase
METKKMRTTTFSDQQLAGQRLMVGFDGTTINEDLKFLINHLKIGGIILFSRNLETPDQIRCLCEGIQNYASHCEQPPLFIAVDQEGGQVARLKKPFTQFPGNPHMKGEDDAIHFAQVTATELNRVGINMNMAPVMDVAPEQINSIMAKRAFGGNPAWVAQLGNKVIEHLQANNVIAVAKHFPGIGRTILDSHQDLPMLDDEMSAIEKIDLIPFQAGIQQGVAGMMLSHIFYKKLDSLWPASLSKKIAKVLLRDQMGFNGIVLTDDLDMGAIVKNYDIQTAIHRILAAEIDLTLICHKGPNIEIAYKELLQKIKGSTELRQKGIKSVERIMKLKNKYL